MSPKKVIICGAGPAGIFAAYLLLKNNVHVTLVEKTGGIGKKFLIAGHSGLNITHAQDLDLFLKKFSPPSPSIVTKAIKDFSPLDIIDFYEKTLLTETFTGSTGHVFPKEMKAGKILLKWVQILKDHPHYNFIPHSELKEIKNNHVIVMSSQEKEQELAADFFIYALGGASWKKTGSKGDWFPLFEKHKISTSSWFAENCGHTINWSTHFKVQVQNIPLKNISITIDGKSSRGEIMLTDYGIEGQLIYQFTHRISESYKEGKKPTLLIDLKPDLSKEEIEHRLERQPVKSSLSTKLKKALKFSKTETTLLNEFREMIDLNNISELSKLIKALPVELQAPRPIDEAISTSGGIKLSECSEFFELATLPNHFCIGEMLDWSAPTGGYLLTACMSTAHKAVTQIIQRN